MTAFLALIRKDLQIFLQDRRAVIMSFIAPVLIGSFFGYVLGGSARSKDPQRVKVLVVDQDTTALSRDIIAKLATDKEMAVEQVPLREAQQRIQIGKASVALLIPAGFAKMACLAMFTSAERPKLTVYVDPSRQLESGMVKGMLTGHVMQAVSKEVFTGTLGKSNVTDALASLNASKDTPTQEQAALKTLLQSLDNYNQVAPQTQQSSGNGSGGLSIPFDLDEQAVTARPAADYNPYAHAFAGMAIQFILFMGIDIGIGILLDKQRGLWKRFASAPLSKWTLLGSRVFSATLISLAILIFVFTFARLVFNVRIEGSLPGFLAVAAAFGLMTSSYGLLIAALGKTPQAARGLSVLATLVMVMLSGAWVPSFLFPGWLQNATQLIPARWAMDGLDAMTWRGLGWQEALLPVAVLLLFAALFSTIAVLRFRWEGQPS